MSTLELLASIVVITGLLGTLVVISNSLRTESARRQTLDILRQLHLALQAYHEKHDAYPPGPAAAAIAALLADAGTQQYIQPLAPQADEAGKLIIRDGYGRPIAYLPPTAPTRLRRDAAASRVDFVSPGADGLLGDIASADPAEVAAVTDNLYGSDTESIRP